MIAAHRKRSKKTLIGAIKRNNKTRYIIAFTGLLWFVMFTALTGCQTLNRFIGKTVQKSKRLPISESKPQPILWQAKDLSFEFTCIRESDTLSLTGMLVLDESYEQFEILDYMFFWVHFLDSEGKLLDSKVAWSAARTTAYTGQRKRWSVKSSLTLPLNATAVAFSYWGQVVQGGGGNWVFYKGPLS